MYISAILSMRSTWSSAHVQHPTQHSMMSITKPPWKDGQRSNGRLPIATAALLTSLFALWHVMSPVDPNQRMITMSTHAALDNAAPHAAGSRVAVGPNSQQQQLSMSTEQALGSVLARLEGALNKTPAAAAPPCNTTAAATAPSQQDPLSGLSAQFLQQVLSLTNYSQLGSAPLLDPLIPSKNYQQMHAVLRQQQTLFCRAEFHKVDVPGLRKANVQGMVLNVYNSADIVSGVLSGAQAWEPAITKQVEWAINQYKPNTGSGSAAAPLVVDIGSNVGWITFSAARMGARVAAFEGMPMNQVLLRHSLCDNPELMERITLYATGLGDTKKDCTVVSPTANAGNGNVICDADVQAGMEELHRKEPAYSYAVRGTMSLRLLDDIFSEDVHLLKIDVEGFEDSVLAGGQQLLASKRVKYLIAEAHMALRGGREGCLAFIKKLYELGFDISYHALAGPFLTKDQVYDPTAPAPPFEVFGKRRD